MADIDKDSKLTTCPDCDGRVSKRAATCPHCGAPMEAHGPPQPERFDVKPGGAGAEEGPLELAEIVRRWQERELPDTALVAPVGESSWLPVGVLMARRKVERPDGEAGDGPGRDGETGGSTNRLSAQPAEPPGASRRRIYVAAAFGAVAAVAVVLALVWPEDVVTRSDLPAPTVEPKPAPKTDRARQEFIGKVSEMLSASAAGGTTSTDLAALVAAQTLEGFAPASAEPRLAVVAYGTAGFKGRRLPAGIVEAKWRMVNRQAGEERTMCVTHASAFDAEFDMWRYLLSDTCDPARRAQLMERWRRDAGFAEK